jgi:hypothetical protein
MPTVKGKQYPYTPAGKAAAARAKKSPDAVKTKGDMISNVLPSTKNLGY